MNLCICDLFYVYIRKLFKRGLQILPLTVSFFIFNNKFENFTRISGFMLPFEIDGSTANHGRFDVLRWNGGLLY